MVQHMDYKTEMRCIEPDCNAVITFPQKRCPPCKRDYEELCRNRRLYRERISRDMEEARAERLRREEIISAYNKVGFRAINSGDGQHLTEEFFQKLIEMEVE